jgi:hypothetical protein
MTDWTPRTILEEVKRRIVADPASYNQQNYCGSVCCIAGHIDILLRGSRAHKESSDKNPCMIWIVAEDFIGERDPWLFSGVESWPHDLGLAWDNEDHVAVACRAIDRYIAERGL